LDIQDQRKGSKALRRGGHGRQKEAKREKTEAGERGGSKGVPEMLK